MSNVSPSFLTNDGLTTENNEMKESCAEESTKPPLPPPLPSKAATATSSLDLINDNNTTYVPVTNDLIQFESPEEMEATKDYVRSQEECLREFLNTEELLTPQDYLRGFYQIRVEQDRFRMENEFAADCAMSPQHFTRNRYRDILPYDHNRVYIKKDEENPDGYMNASFVQLPDGKTRFIAAQAPLPSTLDEWWKMIDEHKVTLIVILCKLVEMNKVKCERYWPEEIGDKEMFGDYEIELIDEKGFDDDEYILRTMSMQNQSTFEIRTVYQLHYREWPDHGCPSGEKQLLNMIEEMSKLHESLSPSSPILVHCSAGVGRTGTIIAVNHIREKINSGECYSINVYELVLALRRQRASMVQTQDQYQFVHRCIAAYCRQRLGIEEPIRPELPTADPPELPSRTASVRLMAPPTPTNPNEEVGSSTTKSDLVLEDDSTLINVPDFPHEPPAPLGPEDLGSAAK